MNSMKKVVHVVNGVTFVVGLEYFVNDKFTLNFILLSDNKQICHHDFF